MKILYRVVLLLCCASSLPAQWSSDPAVNNPIRTTLYIQENPRLVSDGAGGAIITWTDAFLTGIASQDIFAQRISNGGILLWPVGGDTVCIASGHQQSPELVTDDGGGAIITWEDNRPGGASSEIYAQRLDPAGSALWAANGVAITAAADGQNLPLIARDGSGGAIIVWKDNRSGDQFDPKRDIYAQRVNSNGVDQWSGNGVPVTTAPGQQEFHAIVSDGAGGIIVAWRDLRGSSYDIYAQRLNSSGDTLWRANGVPVSTATNIQENPSVTSDGSGGAIIAWHDFNGGASGIYAQRISSGGDTLWAANGIPVAAGSGDETNPTVVSDGAGGAIIIWQDSRSIVSYQLYAQRVDGNGLTLWTTNGVQLTTDFGVGTYSAVSDGSGGAIMTWSEGTPADIYAQKVNSAGVVQWTIDAVPVSTEASSQINPRAVPDGTGGAIIVWQDPRLGGDNSYDLYASRVADDGALPVQMVGMSGEYRHQTTDVRLSWRTASEVDNAGWEVERREISRQPACAAATAGRYAGTGRPEATWSKIGFVEGAGTSTSQLEYAFNDPIPTPGYPIPNPLFPVRFAYRLKQMDRSGSFSYSHEAEVEVGLAPKELSLGQNYPNPFNPTTMIEYSLERDGHVSVKILDALGREVATIVDEIHVAGRRHVATFDARALPSGVYFARIESGGKRLVNKMVLMK